MAVHGGKEKQQTSSSGGQVPVIDQYTSVLELLSNSPYDRDLHRQHIDLAKQLGLTEELELARNMMTTYYALSETDWLEWIDDRKAVLQTSEDTFDQHIELLELYVRASRDNLSIPVLKSYSEYVIGNFYAAQGLSPPASQSAQEENTMQDGQRQVGEPDEVLQTAFSLEDARSIRQEIFSVGGTHLERSQELWSVWRDMETDLLRMNPNPEQLQEVDQLYLSRLAIPHLQIESTFTEYSSFVTLFDNENYNAKLPAANKIYLAAKQLVVEREEEESKLARSKYSESAYLDYIRWELGVKKPNVPLVKSLFDRAVQDFPTSFEIWDAYLEFAKMTPRALISQLEVCERAIKNLPQSGAIWAAYMRASEKNEKSEDAVESIFKRAIETHLFDEDVDGLVALYEEKAGFHRRQLDPASSLTMEIEPNLVDEVTDVLQEGLEKVGQAGNDPQLRLEKHLIHIFERFERLEEARALWGGLTRVHPKMSSVWYGRADFEARQTNFKAAHDIYVAGCSAKGLDYPEYLIEAWLTFERQSGTLADLEYALTKTKRQKRALAKRRAQEAYAAYSSTGIPAAETVTSEVEAAPESTGTEKTNEKKREGSPSFEHSNAKKVKAEPVAAAAPPTIEEPKRDRENSTVFVVAPAETQLTEENLRRLFKDCGEFRECSLKQIGPKQYAMIEFMDKENVLAARTKDKKKINDYELDVTIAWQSCLYVTNFPEHYDKDAVEKLFSQYGPIFATRWPSKRFKNTRRFCYVQYTSPNHAEAALELHQSELTPGVRLVVYISDPGRKKGRTDTDANNKELYVASLSKFVKELDLKRLFEPYGAIKGIRVGTNDNGECKGFAFVEFEEEAAAQASLALNNHELKKRHMSVTIAQSRAVGAFKPPHENKEPKEQLSSRSVVVKGIPPGTEEAIVQQALERYGAIQRVIMESGSSEALVECSNDVEAGRILMLNDTIKVEGVNVHISADHGKVKVSSAQKSSVTPASQYGTSLMPRQASRGRGRVGLGARGNRGVGYGRGPVQAATVKPEAGNGSLAGPDNSVPGAMPNPLPTGSLKSQDDFRAMLSRSKAE